jgi:AcrR family transcriptional regulator
LLSSGKRPRNGGGGNWSNASQFASTSRVTLDESASRSGSTTNWSRGGLYHHVADKTELFAGVIEAVEADVTNEIAAGALAGDDLTFPAVMMRAMAAWLDACEAPDVQRILLTDGPSVLGWARWRELLQPYALSLIETTLVQGLADGVVADLPPRPLAHALVAVAEDAAMYIGSADDRVAARRDMMIVIERTLAALVL